jgi:hypothetical protein
LAVAPGGVEPVIFRADVGQHGSDRPRLCWDRFEVYADHLDWHEVARFVQRGCPSRLAVRIAR